MSPSPSWVCSSGSRSPADRVRPPDPGHVPPGRWPIAEETDPIEQIRSIGAGQRHGNCGSGVTDVPPGGRNFRAIRSCRACATRRQPTREAHFSENRNVAWHERRVGRRRGQGVATGGPTDQPASGPGANAVPTASAPSKEDVTSLAGALLKLPDSVVIVDENGERRLGELVRTAHVRTTRWTTASASRA